MKNGHAPVHLSALIAGCLLATIGTAAAYDHGAVVVETAARMPSIGKRATPRHVRRMAVPRPMARAVTSYDQPFILILGIAF